MTARGPFRSRGLKDSFARTLAIRARQLRREATPAEALLWERLRNYQADGLKFRRQQPLDRFIADFFCAKAKLVVELDGAVHEQRADADAVREDVLERGGLKVIRFANERVMRDADEVTIEITRIARQRIAELKPAAPGQTRRLPARLSKRQG
jgi:very-short-patch-repair endonuclease